MTATVTPADASGLLRALLTRTDIVAWPLGKGACPTAVDNLDALLAAHTAPDAAPVNVRWTTKDGKLIEQTGRFRIGSYTPDADGKTIYGCVDADGGGRHRKPLAAPLGVALHILDRLDRLGIVGLLERSGGGHGWHVWVLFAGLVPASQVRRLLFAVLPEDAPLKDGGIADARSNVGLEVFPKQDRLNGDVGNMVWLPWWHGAPDGANLFYRINVDGELVAYVPELDEVKVSEADLDAALAELAPKQSTFRQTANGSTYSNGDGRVSPDHLVTRALDRVRSGHGRNDTGLWLACQLRDNGHDQATAEATLRDFARSAPDGDHAYRESEAIASVRSAYSRQPRQPWSRAKGWREFSRAGQGTNEQQQAEQPERPIGFCWAPIPSSVFAGTNYRPTWLVRRLLVALQPLIAGGPRKSLKTGCLVDLAVSLASATPFLGEFAVYERKRVALLSGESGEYTLQETAKRICAARGIDLASLGDYLLWQFTLPKLSNPSHLGALSKGIKDSGVEVLEIDPVYLCLLAGQSPQQPRAENLFEMGPLFLSIAEVCIEAGCTPILAHHTRRAAAASMDPLELDDLAYAGIAEFARQWWLVSRRERYQPGTGDHRLWLNVGGSTGHGGLWSVDVAEGVIDEHFVGRRWEVTVQTASAARQAATDERQQERTAAQQQRDREDDGALLAALDRLDPDKAGAVYVRVRAESRLSKDRMERASGRLLKAGIIIEVEVLAAIGSGAKRLSRGIARRPYSGA